MQFPTLLPTSALNERFGDIAYHIEGELVPALHIELDGRMPVYFEHHVLLWKSPQVEVSIKALGGAFKRMFAGMQIFMTQAVGAGHVAFSRDGVGHIFAMHMPMGQAIDVREHQFLAATDNIDYSFKSVKGLANMLFGGTGLFIDTFRCMAGEGILWLHGYGNVFEVTLGPGEQIDVEPGGWIYKDLSVQMDTVRQGLVAGLFGSSGAFVFNRFTGPGRVGIQSMYYQPPSPNGKSTQ